MEKKTISTLTLIIGLILIFGGPFLWRKYRDKDIEENNGYVFGKIVKKTGSLVNGHHWHFNYYYGNEMHQGSWSTHVDYDVNIGDYFVIHLSKMNPSHYKILYKYKLNNFDSSIIDKVWDTIPLHLVVSGRK